jgi:hypothetical protein
MAPTAQRAFLPVVVGVLFYDPPHNPGETAAIASVEKQDVAVV